MVANKIAVKYKIFFILYIFIYYFLSITTSLNLQILDDEYLYLLCRLYQILPTKLVPFCELCKFYNTNVQKNGGDLSASRVIRILS